MNTRTTTLPQPNLVMNSHDKRKTKQKPRLRCNWKGCQLRASSVGELEMHLQQHRKCPKSDCRWETKGCDKEKGRHVWKIHRKWAEQNNYDDIGGECSICGKKFMRQDYVARHRRKHQAQETHERAV
ncbi:hypothetical protein M0657_012068 [Pyricularia oryzae]|nr:hypothetical protein M0657_012068 [Pyricularia oryzae]